MRHRRRRPGLEDFERLLNEFKLMASRHAPGGEGGGSLGGDGDVRYKLAREDFVNAIMAQFEIASRKKINREW